MVVEVLRVVEFEVGGGWFLSRAALVADVAIILLTNCLYAVTAPVVLIRLLDEANKVAGISDIKCDGIVNRR